MSTPITARNRIDFEQKIAEALKAEYPTGGTIDMMKFVEKYQVTPHNILKVLSDHPELGISRLIRATTDPIVAKGR
jgi:hypothetical protein